MPSIVAITPTNVDHYRAVRLRALRENPEAFCATFTRESQLTDADWRERASSLDGIKRAGWMAMADDTPIGLLLCFRNAKDTTQASLVSVWTAPAYRRQGINAGLLGAAVEWARARGFAEMQLEVISNNASAIAFYEAQGFKRTNATKPHGSDGVLEEWEMVLAL